MPNMAVEFDVSQAENGGYQISGVDPSSGQKMSKGISESRYLDIFGPVLLNSFGLILPFGVIAILCRSGQHENP